MLSPFLRCFTLAAASLAAHLSCAQEFEVRGHVLDRQGRPVANASVAWQWRANGTGRKPDGTFLTLTDDDQLLEFWGHIGEMEPFVNVKTQIDGAFAAKVRDRARAVMAMNESRSHGGIVEIPSPYNGEPLQIRMKPLIRVRGKLESQVPDKPSKFSHLYVELPEDSTRPLHISRIVSCGSFDGRFEFRLPAGVYVLDAYGISDTEVVDEIDLRVFPAPKFELKESSAELDLGTLALTAAPPTVHAFKRDAHAQGTRRDYTKHYGEPPPDWHVTDAQGISKDVRIADFYGKWLLIDFWGTSCAPCLAKGIPKMAEFYEKHKSSRDKFELVSVCIEFDGKIRSMAQLNAALAPIQKHAWKGKPIPFPILLDSTFKTWERFGLPGLGTVVLIDPDGNLVEGDESTLERILAK